MKPAIILPSMGNEYKAMNNDSFVIELEDINVDDIGSKKTAPHVIQPTIQNNQFI